jgi:hypothetical protein
MECDPLLFFHFLLLLLVGNHNRAYLLIEMVLRTCGGAVLNANAICRPGHYKLLFTAAQLYLQLFAGFLGVLLGFDSRLKIVPSDAVRDCQEKLLPSSCPCF